MNPSEDLALRIVSLYADVMNVYADRGNLIAIRNRAAERGIPLEVFEVSLGDELLADADLVLIGGGQDREQHRIADELAAHGPRLREWVEAGAAVLAVCGGFQLLGRWYRDPRGEIIRGVEIFDVTSVAPGSKAPRGVGDVVARSTVGSIGEVVGFENHAGRTYLGISAEPFATVEHGFGNNGADGTEGAVTRNAIGTYLHGSVLPKNPALLDHLLTTALAHRRGEPVTLEPLASPYADRAHASAVAVARRRSTAR
jgi:lipid II isoglutaminyl synthase (glutamine-hydrolysing)